MFVQEGRERGPGQDPIVRVERERERERENFC